MNLSEEQIVALRAVVKEHAGVGNKLPRHSKNTSTQVWLASIKRVVPAIGDAQHRPLLNAVENLKLHGDENLFVSEVAATVENLKTP